MAGQRVAVAIQHHPSRAALLPGLLAPLAPLSTDVAVDPDPDGPPLAWRSYRRAIEQTPTWATHRLIVQDDAMPCPNFAAEVAKRLAAQPDRVLVLFHGHEPTAGAQAVREARAHGLSWATADTASFLPAVALVWPAHDVARLLTWADQVHPEKGAVADDWILARYCREHHLQPLIAVPSLVEHPDHVPSIAQRAYQGPPRSSCCPR